MDDAGRIEALLQFRLEHVSMHIIGFGTGPNLYSGIGEGNVWMIFMNEACRLMRSPLRLPNTVSCDERTDTLNTIRQLLLLFVFLKQLDGWLLVPPHLLLQEIHQLLLR